MKRLFCMTLILCISSVLRAAETQTPQYPDPQRWADEINAFQQQDAQNGIPQDSILFVGSSSIRLWNTADAFAGLGVINRGFGGSWMADSLYFADELIIQYKPRLVVVYAGDNDIAGGLSPEAVHYDFAKLAQAIHAALSQTQIICLSIKPSPKRWTLWPQMQEANRLNSQFAQSSDYIAFVDVASVLLDSDGNPDPALFEADTLHLNANGYEKWTAVLSPILKEYYDNSAASGTVTSPDGALKVLFGLDSGGRPLYSIQLNDKDVLKPSTLGLVLDTQSFAENLTLENTSEIETISDTYTMLTGKRKECAYTANRCVFTLKNADGKQMQIIFQVSNDGVAFRYALPDASAAPLSITQEKTSFAFAPATVSWLHPMPAGKSGWSRTQPSYEEYYVSGPVGQPSPMSDGWCLPALFKTPDDIWVLLCDSDVNESYCAVRLAKNSDGGVYHIAFPHPEEHRGTIDPVAPIVIPPFQSPWRVLTIGTLDTLVASTLMTDVAAPCALAKTGFIKPGRAAWHWLRYGDDSATLEYANSFLDFAAKMKWQYILIDANWDRFIGYEKMADFVKQAKAKNVDIILWYNSNGPWNDAPMGPKDKMAEPTVRRQEFAKLQQMGVKGVKVDFFGGDKQATMKLYLEIFKDAADYGIVVNCHGATVPRGWQRTYPNLITMEAVRGMEYCTFEQANTDKEPQHCCILPFTRNAVASMDYTPMVFNPKIRGVTLVTTPAFELALSVVFESGVQHFGLVPDEYKLMPDFVVDYLQKVPTVWNETRLVAGYPGQYVVMARRSAGTWYIGGINGSGSEKELTLDLSFLPKGAAAAMIADGPDRTFVQTTLDITALRSPTVKMSPNAGFVIVTK